MNCRVVIILAAVITGNVAAGGGGEIEGGGREVNVWRLKVPGPPAYDQENNDLRIIYCR